ncbi:MAG TPA: hypothetical protein VEU72_00570 [Nitrosopumilaceae archaeon]|nr:hypothetical protein [Nitrosopumilaceae archaeon]
MADEQEILKKLLVDEKDILKDLEKVVEKTQKIFVIEKSSGKIFFKDLKLSDPQRICAILMGKYFATKLGLTRDHSLGISEIGKEIGRPATALSGPIKQMTKRGYIQKSPNKKYEIAYHRINEILDAILKKDKHD